LWHFLDEIQDSDCLSGWNNKLFDDPYIYKRIKIVLGDKATDALSFPNCGRRTVRERQIELFGKLKTTVEFRGRISLDYMDLFRKYEMNQRPSYKLEAIADELLPDLPKLAYEGSLAQLYRNDFNHFVRYNIRDTEILKGFEDKLGYVNLANVMYHSATGKADQVFGTIRLADLSIVNYCHNVLNVMVPDWVPKEDGSIQGAMVLYPQIGFHRWIGSVDINSLYPKSIESLNISPETIIGQFSLKIAAWEAIRYNRKVVLEFTYENGDTEIKTAAEWKAMLKERKWAVSGYGTVFDQNSVGVIPSILGSWYVERKKYQKMKAVAGENATAIKAKYEKGQKMSAEDKVLYNKYNEEKTYYDRLQYVYKIKLNSTYGALTNYRFRFFRLELGESTTGTGRGVLQHQLRKVTELLGGDYESKFPLYGTVSELDERSGKGKKDLRAKSDLSLYSMNAPSDAPRAHRARHIDLDGTENDELGGVVADAAKYGPEVCLDGPHFNGKFDSEAVVYGDTDSCYFATGADNQEDATKIADFVADRVNKSFPAFMREAFLCQPGYDEHIKCGREVVSDSGIFVDKKRYVLHLVDLDGEKVDKLKVMGLEMRKTTTPKPIQNFLKDTVLMILQEKSWDDINTFIIDYRDNVLFKMDLMDIGLPKGVKKVEEYAQKKAMGTDEFGKKYAIPGHVSATLHFNEALLENGDREISPIGSNTKIKVFYLKKPMKGYKSIALPTDVDRVPAWFTENYPVDRALHAEKLIDNNLGHIFKAIGKEVPTHQTVLFNSLYSF
jgi:DNA polymerase elongation subunit (family B)